MEKQVITVTGMRCGHCKNAVEKAVGALAGVTTANVDLAAKTLTVEFDPAHINVTKIKEVVEDEGFTVE